MTRVLALAALALGACSVVLGCGPGSPGDQALRTFDTITTAVGELDPVLMGAYGREQRACLVAAVRPANQTAEECMDQVTKAWEPVIRIMTTIRTAWCTFDPTHCQETPTP